jgi:isochorismate synthase
MDRVFLNDTGSCRVADSWPVSCDYTQIHALLSQAAEQAALTGQATPASLVLPTPAIDPLRIFQFYQSLHTGECFYWEQPARQMALVGAGVVLSIETTGAECFTQAALAWQQLRREAIIRSLPGFAGELPHTGNGPVLIGGFSFDPLRTRTPLWNGFPAGLLILPRLLFSRHDDQQTLTLNCLVRASDDLDNLMYSIGGEIARLSEILTTPTNLPGSASAEGPAYILREARPAEDWKALVSQAVRSIQQGEYVKVVLAREVDVEARIRPFSLVATLQRLRQSYPGACVFAFQRGERAFIGATPERLVHARDGKLHTMALAGSAPRGASEEEDRRLGSELLYSSKNREEHEIVTATIRDSLADLCSRIWVADTPELLRLRNIQHLQTAIVGDLLPGRSVLEALHTLHPTPAVGGAPTEPALAFIRAYENLDRGWYAGPIGWVDLHGNGEFAVALRSALLEKSQARLFAGCGIVKDSDPAAEYAESCLKLQVILRSLSEEE